MQMSSVKIASRFEGKLFVSSAIAEYFDGIREDAKEAQAIEYENDSLYDMMDDYYFEPYVEEKYDYYEDDYGYDPYDDYYDSRDDYYFGDDYYAERRRATVEQEGQSLGDLLADTLKRRELYSVETNV